MTDQWGQSHLISTQSLSFEDIDNHLDTDAKSQQASLSLDSAYSQGKGQGDGSSATHQNDQWGQSHLISTQSLSFEDIHNHLDTDAKSQQASLNLDNGKAQLPLMQSDSVSGSHKTSTTQSAIAQGQIEVRDDQQTGNNSLAGLSRDGSMGSESFDFNPKP